MSRMSPDRSMPYSVTIRRPSSVSIVRRAASPSVARRWWPTSRRSRASNTARPADSPWPTRGRCPPWRPRRPDGARPRQRSRPHRCEVTEPFLLTAHRGTSLRASQPRRDLRRAAQILLRHNPRLAVHPGGLHQVVVRPPVRAPFLDHGGHMWVIHDLERKVNHRNAGHVLDQLIPETPASMTIPAHSYS